MQKQFIAEPNWTLKCDWSKVSFQWWNYYVVTLQPVKVNESRECMQVLYYHSAILSSVKSHGYLSDDVLCWTMSNARSLNWWVFCFRGVTLSNSFHNKALEKALTECSESLFTEKTLPGLAIAQRVGNMYTPSLYGSLISYLIRLNRNFFLQRCSLITIVEVCQGLLLQSTPVNSYPDNSDRRLIRMDFWPPFRDYQRNVIRLIRISHYLYHFSVPSDIS